jgi:hypothetical protein
VASWCSPTIWVFPKMGFLASLMKTIRFHWKNGPHPGTTRRSCWAP